MALGNISVEDALAYRDETLVCLQKQLNLLDSLETKGLLREKLGEGKDGRLTLDDLPEHRKVVRGEMAKLEKFDVVLAVVGTMKAGKSTTINAIVGRELMPNRNRPMTALPTRICHKNGQTEPVLTFQNAEVAAFVRQLKQALDAHSDWKEDAELQEENLQILMNHIQAGYQFKSEYLGDEGIVECLSYLNDLVRLAEILRQHDDSIQFPYDAVKDINQLPLIEVEFHYLKGKDAEHGNLILLDTPGPNEAGQHHTLRKMLDEQLQRSSAVLLVLDYTQLKSEASASVQEQIKKIPSLDKERLFALVNRFDMRDANSDGEEATKKLVCEQFLKDKILFEHVFPVSANHAYLSNRMLRELERLPENTIPPFEDDESKEKTWVADFIKMAFGSAADADDWEDETRERIQKKAEKCLKKSLIAEPVAKAIEQTHQTAPVVAIRSALAYVQDLIDRINEVCRIYTEFAHERTEEEQKKLEVIIQNLKRHSDSLQGLEEKFREQFKKLSDNYTDEVKKAESAFTKGIEEEIKGVIDERESELADEEVSGRKYDGWKKYVRYATRAKVVNEQTKRRYLADEIRKAINDGKIILKSQKECDDFVEKLKHFGQELNEATRQAANELMNDILKELHSKLTAMQEEFNQAVGEANAELATLGMEGVKISALALPDWFNQRYQIQQVEYSYQHKLKHVEWTDRVEAYGLIARVKRLFNIDSGWVPLKYETWHDDIEKLATEMVTAIKENVVNKITGKIKEELDELEKDYVQENLRIVTQTTQQLINQLQQSQEYMKQNQYRLEEVRREIKAIENENNDLQQDFNQLCTKFIPSQKG